MNTKCFFGFHKWTVHPDKVDGQTTKPHWRDIQEGYKSQGETIYSLHRICDRCGKRQW